MDVLLQLCRSLDATAFIREGCNRGADNAPRFDRVLWLVFLHVSRVSAAARSNDPSLEDFFILSTEQFVAKYHDSLARLDFTDRQLVLSIKYKLSFTLESVCPPPLSATTTSNVSIDLSSRFARCYYTVASVVTHTNDDYRRIVDRAIGLKCVCDSRNVDDAFGGTPGKCRYCQHLMQVARNQDFEQSPYRAPKPLSWLRSRTQIVGEDCVDAQPEHSDVLGRFRRQVIRVDVYGAIKRARSERGGNNVPVKKFRTESLPATLATLLNSGTTDFGTETPRIFNRDMGALLTHFAVNWSKLHYLEPAIFPSNGSD